MTGNLGVVTATEDFCFQALIRRDYDSVVAVEDAIGGGVAGYVRTCGVG